MKTTDKQCQYVNLVFDNQITNGLYFISISFLSNHSNKIKKESGIFKALSSTKLEKNQVLKNNMKLET